VAESVVFARSARRELEQLDAGVARRIISRVEALGSNPRPRGCVKLQGTLPERRPTAAHSAASNTALERPHPQAGFCALTYVLEDSQGAVRSRDSLGNDVIMGPGGIVWTQAGSGVIHHEFPADNDRELHGIQIFVNLSAKDKLAAPRVLRLAGNEVPEWRSDVGDRVRIVVGSFDGAWSPLIPVEPFTLLDVDLRRELSFSLPHAPTGSSMSSKVAPSFAPTIARKRCPANTLWRFTALAGT
jgi:Pirin